MSALRLIVEGSINEARNLLEPDYSMRSSSLNMPLQMSQQQLAHHFEAIPSIRPSPESRIASLAAADFEDIGEEQKSMSYHGVNNTIACGTQVQTDEKQLNAVVDTKDMGSQIFKDVREASCGAASVRTESVGS